MSTQNDAMNRPLHLSKQKKEDASRSIININRRRRTCGAITTRSMWRTPTASTPPATDLQEGKVVLLCELHRLFVGHCPQVPVSTWSGLDTDRTAPTQSAKREGEGVQSIVKPRDHRYQAASHREYRHSEHLLSRLARVLSEGRTVLAFQRQPGDVINSLPLSE